MRRRIIYLDMDYVLVDFLDGIEKLWNIEIKSLLRPDRWDVLDAMSQRLNREVTLEDFWSPIEMNVNFWLSLKPQPWFWELINLVQKYNQDNWYILSAPHSCVSSYQGKILWLRQYLGPTFDRFILTKEKELLSLQGTLLIDDNPENCNRFMQGNGAALLFPAPNNKLHEQAKDPIANISALLDQLAHYIRIHDNLKKGI